MRNAPVAVRPLYELPPEGSVDNGRLPDRPGDPLGPSPVPLRSFGISEHLSDNPRVIEEGPPYADVRSRVPVALDSAVRDELGGDDPHIVALPPRDYRVEEPPPLLRHRGVLEEEPPVSRGLVIESAEDDARNRETHRVEDPPLHGVPPVTDAEAVEPAYDLAGEPRIVPYHRETGVVGVLQPYLPGGRVRPPVRSRHGSVRREADAVESLEELPLEELAQVWVFIDRQPTEEVPMVLPRAGEPLHAAELLDLAGRRAPGVIEDRRDPHGSAGTYRERDGPRELLTVGVTELESVRIEYRPAHRLRIR